MLISWHLNANQAVRVGTQQTWERWAFVEVSFSWQSRGNEMQSVRERAIQELKLVTILLPVTVDWKYAISIIVDTQVEYRDQIWPSNNGIAAHANKTLHDILWDSAEVIEQETNWWKRRFKEAFRIQAEDDTMNLDLGLQLNPIWNMLRTIWLSSFISLIITSSIITLFKYVQFSFVISLLVAFCSWWRTTVRNVL